MFKKILLPTDGSPVSQKAVKQGVALAQVLGASVVGFFSAEDYRVLMYSEYIPASGISDDEFAAQAAQAAAKHLALVEETARAAGVPYEGFHLISMAPWEAIIEAANQKGCDLIFMGSHGRGGLAGLVLGSQTHKVLTHTTIPVLVCR